MPKIPQDDKRIIVTNGIHSADGVLSYVKNVDLSERGVIKLAPPMVKLFSDEVAEGGDVDLDLPVDVFSYDEGEYKVITNDRAFNFLLGNLDFTEDAGYTDWQAETRVINWVGGDWHIGGGDLYSYTGASGDGVYTNVLSVNLDYIELFVNRNSVVGAFGNNIVRQYNTSYSATNHLTLPANFKVTGLKYSNNMMGVATRQLKNQGDAYFFLWDGATTAANSGFPVNDSYIIGLVAYQSSWALMTSAGELLYFNGGGFQQIATLPTFRFEEDLISLGPNNSINLGNLMNADGDIIYAHCAAMPEFSITNRPYRPGFSAGMYCFDPEVGLYHKGSLSYSRYQQENVTAASNVLTFSAAHELQTGDELWLEADDLGLEGGRVYYAIVITTTTIKLATSYDNAVANTSTTITDGTLNNLYWLKIRDYGVEGVDIRSLGLVKRERGYDGFNESGIQPTFLGGKIHPNTVASNRVNVFCGFAPFFTNIGYVITSKFNSSETTDMYQGVSVKHGKLAQNDKIIVKAKILDAEPLIIGDMTLISSNYAGPSVTWDASGLFFETASDLTGVEIGDEVHIFVGAGSGQSAHITAVEEVVTGTWRVTLDEIVRGISSNAKSCVSIEKWKKLGVITANSEHADNVATFPLGDPSPQVEVKVEMRGVGVRIYEIKPNRDTFEQEL